MENAGWFAARGAAPGFSGAGWKEGESTMVGVASIAVEGVARYWDPGRGVPALDLGDDLPRSFTGVGHSERIPSVGVVVPLRTDLDADGPAPPRDSLNLDTGVLTDSGGSFFDSVVKPSAAAVAVGCAEDDEDEAGAPLFLGRT